MNASGNCSSKMGMPLLEATAGAATLEKTGLDKILLGIKVSQKPLNCWAISFALTQIPTAPPCIHPNSPTRIVGLRLIGGIMIERPGGNDSHRAPTEPKSPWAAGSLACQSSLVANSKPNIEVMTTSIFVTQISESLRIHILNVGSGVGLSQGIAKRAVISEIFTQLLVREMKSFVRLNWFVLPKSGVSNASVRWGKFVKAGMPFVKSTAPKGKFVSGSLIPFLASRQTDIGRLTLIEFDAQPPMDMAFVCSETDRFAQLSFFMEPEILNSRAPLGGMKPSVRNTISGAFIAELCASKRKRLSLSLKAICEGGGHRAQ